MFTSQSRAARSLFRIGGSETAFDRFQKWGKISESQKDKRGHYQHGVIIMFLIPRTYFKLAPANILTARQAMLLPKHGLEWSLSRLKIKRNLDVTTLTAGTWRNQCSRCSHSACTRLECNSGIERGAKKHVECCNDTG